MHGPILEAHDLHKRYGENHAVRGVSFDIAQGEIFSLLGPNGAGKTTTISMLSCLLAADQGDAQIDGHSLAADPFGIKRVIGVVPQEIALYPTMTAVENLVFWARMYGLSGQKLRQRVAYGLDLADLADRGHDKVETFSGGMKRRLNIAVGLLHEPKVLFLDEPTVGIDPQSRRHILDRVKALNREGLTVFYTTHYMEEAQELSDRIGIMDHGEVIALGSLHQLIQGAGECDTLRLDLVRNGYRADEIAKGLAALPTVAGVSWLKPATEVTGSDDAEEKPQALAIQAPEAEDVLPGVVAFLNEHGVHIRHIEIQEPNLEAVFLQLTGRALRD